MSITKKDVLHAADLARLELTAEEQALYTEQLSRILNYVEKLSELDTTGVAPTTYTVPLKTVLREDESRPSLPQTEALSNAPDSGKDCFKVPKIIE